MLTPYVQMKCLFNKGDEACQRCRNSGRAREFTLLRRVVFAESGHLPSLYLTQLFVSSVHVSRDSPPRAYPVCVTYGSRSSLFATCHGLQQEGHALAETQGEGRRH